MVNINDIFIPIEQVSTYQQMILCMTGFLWTRYCMVIRPPNFGLMSANFFMGTIALYQLYRKYQSGNFWDN